MVATVEDNTLLAVLSDDERARLGDVSEDVELHIRDTMYESNKLIDHVYFPYVGVVSIVTRMDDGTTIEVATIGREGFVGLPVFLGAGSTPGEAFCQVPGSACRVPAQVFRDEIERGGNLLRMVQRYTQAFFTQMAQSVGCNRAHPINERAARWLLMTHDRMAADEFELTQEFLAQMLGVRRAGVNAAAGMLQSAGFISYRRGHVTILDRAGLESASCECYAIIRDEFDRLLGAHGNER